MAQASFELVLYNSRIAGQEPFVLLSVRQVKRYRYPCVSEHWTDHRTDHMTLDRPQNIPQDGLENRLLDMADKLNS